MKSEKGFRAHNSKGVDKNGAKCNMGFGRISKIYPHQAWVGGLSKENLSLEPGAYDRPMVQLNSECTSHHQHKGHNSVRKPPTLATTKLVTPFISELPSVVHVHCSEVRCARNLEARVSCVFRIGSRRHVLGYAPSPGPCKPSVDNRLPQMNGDEKEADLR